MIKKLLITYAFLHVIFFTSSAQHNFCSAVKSQQAQVDPEQVNGSTASALMNNYDVKFYHLNLDVERTTTYISGWVLTLAVFKTNADTFAFELHKDLSIDSVFSGTQKISFSHIANMGYAIPPSSFIAGNISDIKIYYHGTPTALGTSAIGTAFTNATDWQYKTMVTYSLSQPYSAYEWWPCKQSLQDKIDSSYFYITTDSANKAGSNGLLKNTVVVGDKKRYEWQQIYPIDYYLISVAVAKYIDYSFYAYPINTPPILIQNYIYDTPAAIINIKPLLAKTKGIMELYCQLFGPYVFAAEKYGHCMTTIGGGMEHQTMTSLGSYGFELIAHELGHQWFGDAVTCATWKDIWVNEGFATYSAYLAYEYLDPANAPKYMINSHDVVISGADGSIWIDDTSIVSRIFNGRLTYQKGCSMIHSIRFELNNDTVFFNVLKLYINRFKGGTATALDFKKVLEELSGKDFTQFYNQWFYGEGYPFFNLRWNQLGNKLHIINKQTTSASRSISLFITPLEYKIKTSLGDTIIRISMQSNIHDMQIAVNGTVLSVEVDPNNWLICESTVKKDPNIYLLGLASNASNTSHIYLYPNPATQKFNIEMEGSIFINMLVYDEQGRVVKYFEAYEKDGFNCEALHAGFYIVQINTKNGKQLMRLLIN